ELVEVIDVERDMSRNPLFNVMLILQNNENETFDFIDAKSEWVGTKATVSKFDLSFNIVKLDDEYNIGVEYCTALFEEDSIKLLLTHFEILLSKLVENVDNKIGRIEVVDNVEKEVLLNDFNDTKTDYPSDKTIVELFEEQVERTPDNVAVVYENSKLTYRELNEKANQVAYKLKNMGVGSNDFVAMLTDRSIEMIIGIYGIIKAGGAYIPMDPTYPEERINFMLEDSNPKAVLVYTEENIDFLDEEIPVINLADSEVRIGVPENPEILNKPEDLIYCIYTSGTTGRPKGVMIKNYSVINLCSSFLSKYTKYVTNAALVASYVFDASIQMIFSPILEGGTLHVISDDRKMDVSKLLEYYRINKIDISDCTPSHLKMMLSIEKEIGIYVNILLVGGEELPLDVAKEILDKEYCEKLINVYGPTECTVDSTVFEMNVNNDKVYIGKPINNSKIYILNGDILCGIGMPGEICIGGVGVAKSYLNNSKLTEEKFVDNPFDEEIMYRTGDLARWLPDGNIEYLGRIDEQVKIRGFRVELGEIESRIREISGVRDVSVIVREDNSGNKEIYAYVVYEKDNELAISDIRDELSNSIPGYMIPSYMMQIESIPVTRNGKVDKRLLPEIETKSSEEYVAPRNEIERILVETYQEILKVDKIGIFDDFFLLGGNSIKAMKLVAEIRRKNINISLKDMFNKKNIYELSKDIIRNSSNSSLVKTSNVVMLDGNYVENGKEDGEIIEIISNYKKNILDKQIINSFKPNYIQEGFIYNAFKRNVNMVGDYKVSSVSSDELKKILFDIIQSQSIFRTAYMESEKKMVEYNYGSWNIPFISCERFSREDILKSLKSIVVSSGEDFLPLVMVLQYEKDFEIFVSVNHALWDNMSTSIMYDILCKHINRNNCDNSFNAQNFSDYMIQKNEAKSDFLLAEEKNRYIECLNDFIEIGGDNYNDYKVVKMNIPRNDNVTYDLQWFINKYLKVAEIDNIKEVPLLTLYHGRYSSDCMNTLGMYIEYIPCIFSCEKNKVLYMDKVIDRLKNDDKEYRFIVNNDNISTYKESIEINIHEVAEREEIYKLNEIEYMGSQDVMRFIEVSLCKNMITIMMSFKSYEESEEKLINNIKKEFEID
ncbi:amino acid adenylation domain-containing protein, partial [uncultured Eubacterium sp.]|uniref:non-ribosomal peptide synthetase n=1 Tax=uncultured Eubacterium sp. TaxID=165185 RepID=UPI002592097F